MTKQSLLGSQLDELEKEFRTALALYDHRERVDREARRSASGAVFRRFASDLLAPARLERVLPVSAFAAAALPDPVQLRRDFAGEVFACPADSVALFGGLESKVRMMQRAGDELSLLAACLGVTAKETKYFGQVWLPALAAVDTQATAAGKEFVPRTLSGRTIERIGAAAQLVELFEVIPMPTASYTLAGFSVTPGRPKRHLEQTGDSGQTAIGRVTPARVTLSSRSGRPSARSSSSRSRPARTPSCRCSARSRRRLGDWLAAGVDDCLINGDTAGTHQDADVTSSDDARKTWNGLRKLAPSSTKTDASNAALTAAMLRTNRKKLGRAGRIAGQLAHIVSGEALAALNADSSFISLERYGPHVDPLPNEQGRLDGVPVVVTDYDPRRPERQRFLRRHDHKPNDRSDRQPARLLRRSAPRDHPRHGDARICGSRLRGSRPTGDQGNDAACLRLTAAGRSRASALTYNLAT